jgi:hypothetical protein
VDTGTSRELLDSLPDLQPSLKDLRLERISEPLLAPLTALTALTCCRVCLIDTPPLLPSIFTRLASLQRLVLEINEQPNVVVTIDGEWRLPHLTALDMDPSLLLCPASDLPAALPSLRQLSCCFALAPDDLPRLPVTLTSAQVALKPPQGPLQRPRFADGKVLRWTDASPLSACPHLSSLRLVLHPHASERFISKDLQIEIPKSLTARLEKIYLHTQNVVPPPAVRTLGPSRAQVEVKHSA